MNAHPSGDMRGGFKFAFVLSKAPAAPTLILASEEEPLSLRVGGGLSLRIFGREESKSGASSDSSFRDTVQVLESPPCRVWCQLGQGPLEAPCCWGLGVLTGRNVPFLASQRTREEDTRHGKAGRWGPLSFRLEAPGTGWRSGLPGSVASSGQLGTPLQHLGRRALSPWHRATPLDGLKGA